MINESIPYKTKDPYIQNWVIKKKKKGSNSENGKKLGIRGGHQHEGIRVQASRFRNFSPPLASCEKQVIKVRDMWSGSLGFQMIVQLPQSSSPHESQAEKFWASQQASFSVAVYFSESGYVAMNRVILTIAGPNTLIVFQYQGFTQSEGKGS